MYLPIAIRNPIGGPLLVKLDYKIVIEVNKIVITESKVFIGNGFVPENLLKLNVILRDMNEISLIYCYNVESSNVRWSRLVHVNLRFL